MYFQPNKIQMDIYHLDQNGQLRWFIHLSKTIKMCICYMDKFYVEKFFKLVAGLESYQTYKNHMYAKVLTFHVENASQSLSIFLAVFKVICYNPKLPVPGVVCCVEFQ